MFYFLQLSIPNSFSLATPDLSKRAKLLLEIEWKKYSDLLQNHLQLELGLIIVAFILAY